MDLEMTDTKAFDRILKKIETHEKNTLSLANDLSQKPIELTRYRNERNLMFYPICSTSKGKRLKPINYESQDGKYFLEVSANHTYGMVKATDLDVLRYAISKASEIKWKTGLFPKQVEFSAYEMLKSLKKPTSGKSYEWAKSALARLSSTTYKTNIWKGEETVFFHLAECSYENKSKKLEKIRIKFNDRLIESIQTNNSLLTVDDEIMLETKSQLRKRLLELVKTAIGNKKSWQVGFQTLKNLLSSEDLPNKEFKRSIEKIDVPWSLEIHRYEKITFTQN
jgi:plasmid replication initiation protein